MIPPRAKLADLAIAAGVSTATVSRVLNGKPGVADATRTSVLATLERLGFAAEPDQPSGEGLIAVMVPELANPSFALFANELALVLTAAGRHMILCTAGPGGTSEEQYLDALLGVEIAGIISVSGTPADTEASPEHYQRLIDAGVPAVFINGYTPGVEGAFFSCSDAEAISISVAQTLDLSVLPFMMALTVAGAASFLTPIATPANLMVMEPAGYRFGDYWKLGLPLALFFIAMAVFYVPLLWPF